MDIQIVKTPVSIKYVTELASMQFGNLIKATVDITQNIMALGGELHADEEQLLLDKGSKQQDLWGINLYPSKFGSQNFVEFDSMINIRPSTGNMTRGVDSPVVRQQILDIVSRLVVEK